MTNNLRQNLYSSKEILIVYESHPELLSLIQLFEKEKRSYSLISTFFLTKMEFQILKLFYKQIHSRFDLKKILIVSKKGKPTLIRDKFLIKIVIKVLAKFGLSEVSHTLNIYNAQRFNQNLSQKISQKKTDIVIFDQTTSVHMELSGHRICIAYHGEESFVREWEDLAFTMYPDWSAKNVQKAFKTNTPTYQTANDVIVLSTFARLGFEKYGSQNQRLHTIHAGALNRNDQYELVHKKFDLTNVLYIGRITAPKGVPSLLNFHSTAVVPFKLTVVGPKNENFSFLKNYQQKTGNFYYLSGLSNRELREAYISNSIFVLPSFYEGFSIALLEAMSYGLIPIASENSVAKDLFPGTSLEKLLFSPKNPHKLNLILEHLNSLEEQQINEMREEAFSISSKHSYENFAKNLDLLIKDIT